MLLDPVAAIALSLLLSYVLVDAGLHKLRDPLRYGAVINGYRLLPSGSARGSRCRSVRSRQDSAPRCCCPSPASPRLPEPRC